ncbi:MULTISPECIES: LacI family DNA-binding transcriptional regulator [unclassified Pseudoclavibacter]|uniref:LacI family DNA-binding transcriptional regulator n=1 Tax=unclassified Pseudoclavibacter TaxID=2615177 RepID=UPI000CE8EFA1|nr:MULTISPECIES: LacI family DNA-binding transcriptional regulator [unclassified Pseudoclavibacter]PPF36982.1 LacI family transcriptional regulator [Pseudoclavibacter sp. AY1H1]PPG01930.1 LacI family transcriptional regulator [Pseudoclavibacter sp. RFBI5]
MSTGPVTILDLARELGLSPTTVSSALHGRGRVSERTRELVMKQAQAMGYVSNRAAQALRGGKHNAIGLHLISSAESLAFYMEFVFGVTEVAAAEGNDLVLFTEGGTRAASRSLNVDGLIALDSLPGDAFVADALRRKVPVVAVGPYRGEASGQVMATIAAAQGALTGRVMDALASIGGRRPALVSIDSAVAPQWSLEVDEAYRRRCENDGNEPLVFGLGVHPVREELIDVLNRIDATDGIDSILVIQEGVAPRLKLLRAARGQATLPIATMSGDPRTESGLDDFVSVDLRPRAYGRAAGELMFEVLRGEAVAKNVLHDVVVRVP